jgi:hypothetical protein
MNSRRHAFALAGVLTATALTGALAVAGISNHQAASPTRAKAQVVQIATPPPQPAPRWEDD